jgi:hypothetical protein
MIVISLCPRFHVDRSQFGLGSEGKSDEESGIFLTKEDIKQPL